MRLWIIGSPICTAETGLASSSARLEKVAPWMPSLPTRPPSITASAPGRTVFSHDGCPFTVSGMMPPVPQKTSGLPMKLSSKRNAPAAVGMPD